MGTATFRTLVLACVSTLAACVPQASLTARAQRDTPRRQRGVDVSAPLLAFRGRAGQMGDLERVASTYRLIAVDAEPANNKFSREDVATLRAGGRNTVLGILNVGFCDRTQSHWSTAPDGLLPCVANLSAQIGERRGHFQQVWMNLDDFEYQRLLIEHVGPRLEKAGVDGFLLDGLELLDHGPDDEKAPCDAYCIEGGVEILEGLRSAFPDLVILMDGGLSAPVRQALGRRRAAQLLDGIVGDEVYAPEYDAQREKDLIAWRRLRLKVNGAPFATFTQDYVKSCGDVDWARTISQASRSHGFSPAVGLSSSVRPQVCFW